MNNNYFGQKIDVIKYILLLFTYIVIKINKYIITL